MSKMGHFCVTQPGQSCDRWDSHMREGTVSCYTAGKVSCDRRDSHVTEAGQ